METGSAGKMELWKHRTLEKLNAKYTGHRNFLNLET